MSSIQGFKGIERVEGPSASMARAAGIDAARDAVAASGAAGAASALSGRVEVLSAIPTDVREALSDHMAAFLIGESGDDLPTFAAPKEEGGAARSPRIMVIEALLDPARKAANAKPRLEERSLGGGAPFQLALAFSDGAQRARFSEYLAEKAPDLSERFAVVSAGSTTLEIGLKGIDKAAPMRFLSNHANLRSVLGESYRPGTRFDVLEHPTVIFADFDGTLVNAPKKGESAESQNLGNSPAKEAIIAYLEAGGVLVVNSGNDVERVVNRVAPFVPEELLGNILVAGAGGNALVRLTPAGFEEVEGYREACSSGIAFDRDVEDVIYLGDDKRAKGNDRKGFEFVGKKRAICFATDPHLEDGARSFLDPHNVIIGGPRAASVFFEKVRGSDAETVSVSSGSLDRSSPASSVGSAGGSERSSPAFSEANVGFMVNEARKIRGEEMLVDADRLARTVNMLRVLSTEDGQEKLQATLSKSLHNVMRVPAPSEPISWAQMRRLAAGHAELQEVLEKPLASLDAATKAELALRATQLGLKELGSYNSIRLQSSLNLVADKRAERFVGLLADAPFGALEGTFLPAFNEGTSVVRSADGKIEVGTTAALEASHKKLPTGEFDALLIMGNNDLRQVDNAVRFYLDSTKALREGAVADLSALPEIYISGFGGHGTSAGMIFAHTEAETMREHINAQLGHLPRAMREAIMGKVVIEPDATNSGQNVQFLEKKFGDPEAAGAPKRFVVSGTPSAVKRQVLSFAAQTKYPFESVESVPMDHAAYMREYYPEGRVKDGVIHYMCRVREAISFLNYSATTRYVYPTTFASGELASSVRTIAETYTHMTRRNPLAPFMTEAENKAVSMLMRKRIRTEDEEEALEALRQTASTRFEDAYNLVMRSKLGDESIDATVLKTAQERVKNTLDPVATYFRDGFATLEERYMKRVETGTSLKGQQRELLLDRMRSRRSLVGLDLAERPTPSSSPRHGESPVDLDALADGFVEDDSSDTE